MTNTIYAETKPQTHAYVFELGEHRGSLDDKLLLLALQGIVNREAPSLLIDGEGLCDWAQADKRWLEVYAERKNINFDKLATVDDLVRTFKDRFNGLVIYDPKLDASRYIAVTTAGLNSYLPVSPNQIKGEIAKLQVKEDFRGRWDDAHTAYRWAMKELLPKCSKTVAFNAGQSHDEVQMGTDKAVILALDYAVSRKGFIFNLAPSMEDGVYGWEKWPIPGYPEDARLMDEILDKLTPIAKVYGWAEPEWTMTSKLSRHGHCLMCGTAGNLSFHAAVPAEQKTYKQPGADIKPKTKVEDKYYLAFMTNEGDTARVLTSFFFGGWLNPDRGKFPVNWGINPTLLHDFPFFAEYYFGTATKNDYFYAGVSGPAYVFIDQLPSIEQFAKFGKPYFDQFDIHIVDAWDEHDYTRSNYETYAKEAGVKLFTLLPRGETRIELLSSGVPVLVPDERVHYKTGNADKNVPDILEIATEHPAPFIIPLYGGLRERTPANYMEIMERLPSDKFEAVTLSDLASLAPRIAERQKAAENR